MAADDESHRERLKRNRQNEDAKDPSGPPADREAESAEASCGAFGYLRGIRDLANSLEFRLREGNSIWFPYGWLGTWQYDPSEGLLLKFSGDLVYLVLIKGSNLDQPIKDGTINLIHAGLQRHRVLWVREMTRDEIARVGENGPTIDTIEVAEFESHAALRDWLTRHAAAFLANRD